MSPSEQKYLNAWVTGQKVRISRKKCEILSIYITVYTIFAWSEEVRGTEWTSPGRLIWSIILSIKGFIT